jgi:GAF domain-containing protein
MIDAGTTVATETLAEDIDHANSEDGQPTPPLRQLLAIREIAHALLVADRPEDVHQFALDRVTPILGAQFSLVMRLGEDGELLRPVAQHEWPLQHRAWIGALRVRVGSGPSGMAVQERQLIEVRDLFADPDLADWHDVARELGFRSILAAPLVGSRKVIGAIAFYFADETNLSAEQRALVRLVADQLAATIDKASLIDELRRTNAALAEANAQLERLANDAEASRIARDRFFEQVMGTMAALLAEGDAMRIARAATLAVAALDLIAGDHIADHETSSDVEPRTPLLASVARYRQRFPTVPVHVEEPTVMLPTIRANAPRLERLIDLVLAFAVRDAIASRGSVQSAIEVGRGFVSYRVTWPTETAREDGSVLDLAMAQGLARQLGGEMQVERAALPNAANGELIGDELTATLIFPVDMT